MISGVISFSLSISLYLLTINLIFPFFMVIRDSKASFGVVYKLSNMTGVWFDRGIPSDYY